MFASMCVSVCMGVRGCVQVWEGVHGYAQVCAGVHRCACVCTGVRGYAWVWDVFSEFLLENRVPTSADFNTFPIRILIFLSSLCYILIVFRCENGWFIKLTLHRLVMTRCLLLLPAFSRVRSTFFAPELSKK